MPNPNGLKYEYGPLREMGVERGETLAETFEKASRMDLDAILALWHAGGGEGDPPAPIATSLDRIIKGITPFLGSDAISEPSESSGSPEVSTAGHSTD